MRETKRTLQSDIKKAFDFGVAAFKANKQCIPCSDHTFMSFIQERQFQNATRILIEWQRGWTTENLKCNN